MFDNHLRRRLIGRVERIAGGSVVAMCAMTSCAGDDGELGVVRSGLDQIPVEAYNIAFDSADSFDLSIGDLSAASELIGIDMPAAGRDEADIRQWQNDLSVSGPDRANDTGLALLLPRGIEIVQASMLARSPPMRRSSLRTGSSLFSPVIWSSIRGSRKFAEALSASDLGATSIGIRSSCPS
jgi:hypothetical protein